MKCGAYLRQLWTSRHVSKSGALEATYYLVQPWLQLIETFVYPVPAIVFVTNYLAGTYRDAGVGGGGRVDDPGLLSFRGARAVHALGAAVPQALRAGDGQGRGPGARRRLFALRPDLLCHLVAGFLPHSQRPHGLVQDVAQCGVPVRTRTPRPVGTSRACK